MDNLIKKSSNFKSQTQTVSFNTPSVIENYAYNISFSELHKIYGVVSLSESVGTEKGIISFSILGNILTVVTRSRSSEQSHNLTITVIGE